MVLVKSRFDSDAAIKILKLEYDIIVKENQKFSTFW